MINKAILIGNVGKDPEVRRLDSGTTVAKFPLATNEVYKNRDGENVKNTEWHNIVLWRKLAEFAESYITKGKLLYVEGKIRTRSYDDKDGNKKYFTEIVGDVVQFLSKKSDDQGDNSSTSAPPADDFSSGLEDEADDLPF